MSSIVTAGLALALGLQSAAPLPTYSPAQKLRDFEAAATGRDEWFGASVAIAGDTAVVGAPMWRYNTNSDGSAALRWGHVLVYVRKGGRWFPQADIYAPHAGEPAMDKPQFGRALALDGDTLVVGTPEADYNKTNNGLAYVFARSGNTWAHQTTLIPPGTDDSNYGDAVAIWGDTIVVGGPRSDLVGKACTFRRTTTTWGAVEACKVGLTNGERSGHAVAIHGNLMLIGAPRRTVGGKAQQGAVDVFQRSTPGGPWIGKGTIDLGAAGAAGDEFGWTIILSGTVALIGAPAGGTNNGRVHVFDIDPASGLPVRSGELPSPAPQAGGRYGASISLAADRVVVGAPGEDGARGAMYVFQRLQQGTTAFSPGMRLVAADRSASDNFGYAVGISGNAVIAGAPFDDHGTAASVDQGSAHVFNNDLQQAQLIPDALVSDRSASGAAGDAAGEAIAVARNIVVVGAPDTGAGANGAGEVLVLGRDIPSIDTGTVSPGTSQGRTVLARLKIASGQVGDKFGAALDVTPDGSTIVVGAPGRGDSGALAVFRRPVSGQWNVGSPTFEEIAAPALANGVVRGFGESVAIAPDGRIAAGAPDSVVGNKFDAGAAFVFEPSNGTHSAPPAILTSDVPAADGRFGEAVDATDRRIVVGEPFDETAAPTTGRLHLFDAASTAVAGKRLKPAASAAGPKGISGNKFASRVSIAGDVVVAGAPAREDVPGESTGGATVYDVSAGTLRQVAELSTGAETSERAGSAVSVAIDAETRDVYVALGADGSQRDQAGEAGSAYLYIARNGRFTASMAPMGEIATGRLEGVQRHGSSIAIDEHGLVVGVPGREVVPSAAAPRSAQGGIETYVFERLHRNGFE